MSSVRNTTTFGLEDRCGDRRALQVTDRFDQDVASAARLVGALPRRKEPRECMGVDGLDLSSERRERTLPQPSKHVGIAPLDPGAPRREPALGERIVSLEIGQRVLDPIRSGGSGMPGR